MRHGSLFSGIGGFDLAAEWMGWENMFHCEWNEFGQKILKYYWPNAKSYGDITKTDFTFWRGKIDILTGGFPCQPYSTAGKRKGKEDDRHLWPEMLRATREISPRWIVGENVRGLTNWNGGLVFDEVQADLEAEGYEVTPFLLPACGVNAPHRRDRIWFVAHRIDKEQREQAIGWLRPELRDSVGATADTGLQRQKISEKQTTGIEQCDKEDVANPENVRHEQPRRTRERRAGFKDGDKSTNTNAGNKGLQGSKEDGNPGVERENGNQQSPRLLQPDWEEFPTQSPICGGNDGVPRELDGITFSKWRNESIKGYGNAIVPQVVYQIFKTIEQYEAGT